MGEIRKKGAYMQNVKSIEKFATQFFENFFEKHCFFSIFGV